MGTNCLGPFLLTRLLLPLLTKTAAISAPNSVRVTWAASVALDGAPEHGIEWNDKKKAPVTHKSQSVNYAQSKVGNLFLAAEFARRHGRETGVVSAAYNPGNLRTELMRHANPIAASVFVSIPFFFPLEPYLPSFFFKVSPHSRERIKLTALVPRKKANPPLPRQVGGLH